MNRVGVLEDVAYALSTGAAITNIKDVDLLAVGAMAVFNVKGEMLSAAGANAATVLADQKEVYFAFGRNETPLLVNIPRNVKYINLVNKRDAVAPIITVGGVTTELALPLENEGDAVIKVFDNTLSNRFGIPSIRASVYKKASMSVAQMFAKLASILNESTMFGGITATVINTDSNYGLTITPKVADVSIAVALGGMFEGGSIVTTTLPVAAFGAGKDVHKMEFEASVEEGNGAYIERTTDWFKGTLQTNQATQYDMITIGYDAWHQGPTTQRHVMDKTLSVAIPDGATLGGTEVMALLATIFPTYATVATGQETATDDGTDVDGITI